jgi:flagellar biosynthetic protein FliP
VQIIVLVTLLSIGPAVLMLVTSFTRIVIVLGLTRNALNLQGVPPNQVIIGLSLFLTVFVMSPVLTEVNNEALKPYLNHEITQEQAFERGAIPVKEFMAKQVRESDLAMFIDLSGDERPTDAVDVPFTTLVPAFVIGELRAAFIIGFVIFIPFLIIDLVVSASLMSMGMVMVQPMTVALPFKLLLFVLVDGWQLLAGSLIRSFVR